AAQAELDGAPPPTALTEADVYAMINYLGDVGHALNQADPARLEELYAALRLDMTYDAEARAVDVSIRPGRRGSECVRGGT
ncbi:MAG: recombinase family protein, partial [Actinomycetota bacterium]|nr:recombinase family protein [Actinomycetota bacterium]